MGNRNIHWTVVAILLVIFTAPSLGQQMYQYIDRQTGAHVFTNVQPTEREAPELAAQWAAEAKVSGNAGRTNGRSALTPVATDPSRFNGLIQKHADLHQIDANLIKAVIRAESNFNPHALSPKGAKGLMQLMPATARRFGVVNIYDPDENIQGGIKYLRFLLDMFDQDLKYALAAYNAGENAVLRVGGIPPIRETVDYVRRVTRFYGSDKHMAFLESPNPFGVWVSREKDGTLLLTNIGPPRLAN